MIKVLVWEWSNEVVDVLKAKLTFLLFLHSMMFSFVDFYVNIDVLEAMLTCLGLLICKRMLMLKKQSCCFG